MQIRRRTIFYVQGYDPRGIAEYYRMFRREFRCTCELYGLTGKISGAQHDPKRFITSWDVSTHGDGWQVETRYQFLRWEDIIRQDFARPAWWKIAHMYAATVRALLNGVIVRMLRAHWRFGLFTLYTPLLMTLWLALGVAIGILASKLVAALGAPLPVPTMVGLVAAIGSFGSLLWLTESRTYLLYLCDDVVATDRFAHCKRPDWDERLETFAGYVADAMARSDADEIIVIGHSSGSFLAVDVLDRALARDPALGRHGPRVRLLTLGANLPIVGFHPAAQWFRDRMRRLAHAPDIDWVDYQSRHDVMNFWPFDPITGHGIEPAPGRTNPTVVAISFRDLWKGGHFGRRRWRFFSAHFQFLLANERLGSAYDYYLICCGPFDLMTRATAPDRVTAAAPEAGTSNK
ncbi:MAG: alpha/beta hydrolase [Pseudolabrys sp.]|nr:alpha/beta hydrolase [Pseudolabrys sp.]